MKFYIGGIKVEGDLSGLKIHNSHRNLRFSDMECPESSTTWLTAGEKETLVERLEHEEQSGGLDVGSIVPLRHLNTLPGLVSEWSCTGHQDELGGYLVLRVSREIAEVLDTKVIGALWEGELIHCATKEWRQACDTAGRPVPRVGYILRFHMGFLERVCEIIHQLIKESTNAVL